MSSIIEAIEIEDVPSVELAAPTAAAVLDETTLEFPTPVPVPEPEPAPELEATPVPVPEPEPEPLRVNEIAAAAAVAGGPVDDFIVSIWAARDILARAVATDTEAAAALAAATRMVRAVVDGYEQAAEAASSAMSELFVLETLSAPAGAPAAPAAPAADYMTPVWFALGDGIPRQGVLARDLAADASHGLVMWWDIPATAGSPGVVSSVGTHVCLLAVADSPTPSSFWF